MIELVADSIAKSFRGTRVLSAASISLGAGTITGLLGRMGSGKSTLIRICAGLSSPDSGWIEFQGKRFASTRLWRLSTLGLHYIPSENELPIGWTLRRQLELLRRRYRDVDENVVERLDISSILDTPTTGLSGGEIRRAQVAVALFRKPTCLISDEPFRGLDPLHCESVGGAFRNAAANGCAILISGHEWPTIRPAIDSVTWLTSGTTYNLGASDSAAKNEGFRREYLGTGSA